MNSNSVIFPIIKAIRALLDAPAPAASRASTETRAGNSGQPLTRVVYLPLPHMDIGDADEELRYIAGEIEATYVSDPGNALAAGYISWYRTLLRALNTDADPRLAEARRVLDHATLTPELEGSILARLRKAYCNKRLLIVAHTADAESISWLKWAVATGEAMGLRAIVVAAPRPPGVPIEKLSVNWTDFLDMTRRVIGYIEPEPEPKKPEAQTAGKQAADPPKRAWWWPWRSRKKTNQQQPGEAVAEAPKQGIFTKILQWLRSAPLQAQEPKGKALTDLRWALFMAKAAYPTHLLALRLHQDWEDVRKREAKLLLDSKTSQQSEPTAAEQQTVRRLREPTQAERETLEGRARFLATIKRIYPDAYADACADLDGCDQLYRLQLVLCGGALKDTLVAGALLPEWRRYLDDTRFCELFRAALTDLQNDCPLVQRFESRTQLLYHLRWLEHATSRTATTMREIHKKFDNWVVNVAAASSRKDTPPRLGELTEFSAHRHELIAAEILEIAQMRLTETELFYGADKEADLASVTRVDELIDEALAGSRGALRLECTHAKARLATLKGEFLLARELLRSVRRTYRDPLAIQATALQEAFVREREGDYFSAMNLYMDVLREAESLAADELSARAVWGRLRCRVTATAPRNAENHAEIVRDLRAEIMVRIQAARAPALFGMSERQKPRVFISYRNKTQNVATELRDRTCDAYIPWCDTRDLKEQEDFSPTIHLELLDSDAIVLVLSQGYFDSRWCTYELDFAIGHHETRRVPLYWCWCRTKSDETTCADDIDVEIEQWWHSFSARHDSSAHYKAYVKDRLDRVRRYGVSLQSSAVVVPESGKPDLATIIQRLLEARDLLYRRAGLDGLTPDSPPEDPPATESEAIRIKKPPSTGGLSSPLPERLESEEETPATPPPPLAAPPPPS